MTSLVLETMREKSPDAFKQATELVWKSGTPISAAALLMTGDPHVHHSKASGSVVDIDVIGESVVYDGSSNKQLLDDVSVKDIIAEHNNSGFPGAMKQKQGTPHQGIPLRHIDDRKHTHK